MSGKPKRKPRGVSINPIATVMGALKMHKEDRDSAVFGLALHIEEIKQLGEAHTGTTRCITVHLAAAVELAELTNNSRLGYIVNKARANWLRCSNETLLKGITDRLIIDNTAVRSLETLFVALCDVVLPITTRNDWDSCIASAISYWDAAQAKHDERIENV